MSRIRTNLITNRMANGAPTVSNGLVISGVTTATTLDVNGASDFSGDAVFNSNVDIVDAIVHVGDTDTKIRFPSADTFSVETGGSEVLSMNLDGLVTGGQTNPTSSDNGNIYIKNASSIGGVGHAVNYVSNAVFNGAWKYITSGQGATRIVVNQNGYQFDTAGSGTAGNNITFSERFHIKSDGKVGINTSVTNDTSELLCVQGPSGDNATIGIKNNSTSTAGILGFHDTAGTFRGRVQYNHQNDSMQFNTAGSQRMRILSDGRVLINTEDGAAFSSRKLTISDLSSGGTTAMEIRSATNGTGRIYFTDSTSSSDAGSYAGKVFYDHADDHMAFYTGGGVNTPGSRMKIDAYGRITKPNQPLFVAQKSAAISGGGSVVFNTVIENVGSCYNSSNGRFTAPVAGYYWFCCKINAYKRIDWHFRRNGSGSGNTNREISQFNTSNQDGWYSHNLIRIFELSANDWMEVYITSIYQNSDPGEWITFQGYLLQ